MDNSFRPAFGTNHPHEASVMSTAMVTETASRWARMLEQKHGTDKTARMLKVPAGTVETLRRGRKKNIGISLWQSLRGTVIRELTKEIERLTHEVQIARQAGMDPRDGDLVALEAAIEKAQEFRRDLSI